MIRRKSPSICFGAAVAGTIAAPYPSKASDASSRTPSISACARSVTSTLAAARSSTRRSAAPFGGRSSGTSSSSRSDIVCRSASGCELCTSNSRSSANRGSTSSSGSSMGRWMIAALSWPDSTPGTIVVVLPSLTIGCTRGWRAGDRAQQLRHQPAGRGADHADAGVAGDVVVERGDVGGDVVDLVEDPPCPLDDPLTLLGETAVGAVDQGDAELAFELGDMTRDVGLHGVEGPGRRRERPVISDGNDGGELTYVHVAGS